MKTEKFFTYILISKNSLKTYTGSTKRLKERLLEHNSGKNFYTKAYRPFELLHSQEFNNLVDARRQERFFKTTTGRRQIKEFIEGLKSQNITGESATRKASGETSPKNLHKEFKGESATRKASGETSPKNL